MQYFEIHGKQVITIFIACELKNGKEIKVKYLEGIYLKSTNEDFDIGIYEGDLVIVVEKSRLIPFLESIYEFPK